MRKLRTDALWQKLTADQQNKIQHWLFEERLSYTQTHARMQQELGIVCGRSALGSIYHRCDELRSCRPTATLLELANMVNASEAEPTKFRAASHSLIAAKLLEKAIDRADTKEIVALGRLVLKAEENEMKGGIGRGISRHIPGPVRDNPG